VGKEKSERPLYIIIRKGKGFFMLFLRDLAEIWEWVGATPKKKEEASLLSEVFRPPPPGA
jgi:hypothetical protein